MEETKKKKSILTIVLKTFKFVFLSFFPGLKFIAMNKDIKKAKSFVKNKWFAKQVWRNRIIALALSLPLLLSFGASFKIISADKQLAKGVEKVQFLISKKEIKRSIKEIKRTLSYRDTKRRIEISSDLMLYGFLISFLFGWTFIYMHPILGETKRFTKILKSNGIIDDKEQIITLATPVGFLIRITGNSSAKAIKDNDVIWRSMNVQVGTFSEDSSDRSMVFFYKTYELQKLYEYKLKESS